MSGGRDWTGAEERQLRQMWAEGMTQPAIAENLGRTSDSINSRRRDLGLPPRKRGWPKGVPNPDHWRKQHREEA